MVEFTAHQRLKAWVDDVAKLTEPDLDLLVRRVSR